ncbi:hypothetical protein N0V85_003103 [Neurospora sp. IMI 360204]|nr:hypothetical protein N0V85_003103 [Neurospora sp. IMI 360204]
MSMSGGRCIGSIGSNAGQPDYVENVVFENVERHDSSNAAWIKTYPGHSYSNCDSSRISITDIRWENITGTARYNVAAGLHCTAAPCDNLRFSGIDIKPLKGGNIKTLCSNIKNQASSGLTCTGPCPGSHPQQLSGNV